MGRGTASRKITTKETRQVAEDKTKLTEHFIATLPQLLAKVRLPQLLAKVRSSQLLAKIRSP